MSSHFLTWLADVWYFSVIPNRHTVLTHLFSYLEENTPSREPLRLCQLMTFSRVTDWEWIKPPLSFSAHLMSWNEDVSVSPRQSVSSAYSYNHYILLTASLLNFSQTAVVANILYGQQLGNQTWIKIKDGCIHQEENHWFVKPDRTHRNADFMFTHQKLELKCIYLTWIYLI